MIDKKVLVLVFLCFFSAIGVAASATQKVTDFNFELTSQSVTIDSNGASVLYQFKLKTLDQNMKIVTVPYFTKMPTESFVKCLESPRIPSDCLMDFQAAVVGKINQNLFNRRMALLKIAKLMDDPNSKLTKSSVTIPAKQLVNLGK